MPLETFTAGVERRSPGIVIVTRKFDAPRELVWKAYTTPELLLRWLNGSDDWQMTTCESDFRVGGTFRWRWKANDGSAEFGFFGEFREIDRPRLIVNTETFDPGTTGGDMGTCTTTVTLDEVDGVTTMRTVIDYGSDDLLDSAMATGMTDGMEISYQKLDRLLPQVV